MKTESDQRIAQVLKEAFRNPFFLAVAILGFSGGLPLLLTKSTLKTWLSSEGIDIKTVGLFSLAGLPYTLKFLWAPVLDYYFFKYLGRRRTWLLLSQAALVLAIATLAFLQPANNLPVFAVVVIAIAFFSSTQDNVIDAHRRETLLDHELGLGSSVYVYGYRMGMWISQVIPLFLADLYSWQVAYLAMASVMTLNLLVTFFLVPEPEFSGETLGNNFFKNLFKSIGEFFDRLGLKTGLLILLFIFCYKFGDSYASVLTYPFFVEAGFSKTQIASVTGSIGFFAQFFGLFLGGVLILKLGVIRSLWLFGFLQIISTAGFSIMALDAYQGDITVFSLALAFENTSAGMGTAAFLAFMAQLSSKTHTATQYAIMTSLMAVPLNLFGSTSGYLYAYLDSWFQFFLACTLAGIPGMALLYIVIRTNPQLRN